jgi:recombination protein RecA
MVADKAGKNGTALGAPRAEIDPVIRERERARRAALEEAVAQVQKKCGQGAVMRLGRDTKLAPVEVVSTGSLSLDAALGVGGIPRGRIIEIFGPESSGKTTLALHVIANAQRNGGAAAFVDAEHALDPQYARRLGVDLDALLVSQPDYGEQALDIAEMLMSSGGLDVVVIDSVAALVPKTELEGEMGDQHVGLQARMMSQAMRRLTAVCHRTNTAAIFINQIREKIGVMFGSPETTTGGRALKFYSSVRLDIRRIGQIKDGEVVIGNRTVAKVVKNKVAPPFRNAEFDILYNRGISWTGDVLDTACTHGIVKKVGAWFAFGETKIGQGREKAIAFLEENRDILVDIESGVLAHVFPPEAPPGPPQPPRDPPADDRAKKKDKDEKDK